MGLKLAVLCYVKEGGKTLMLYRNKKPNDIHKNKWNGLGGKLEKGESPEEALVREVKEEANIKLLSYQLKGIITFPDFNQKEDWYVYLYTSHEYEGKINYHSNEGELQWIPNQGLFELNLWEGDHLFLKWINEKKFFSAKMVYKDKVFIEHKVNFY